MRREFLIIQIILGQLWDRMPTWARGLLVIIEICIITILCLLIFSLVACNAVEPLEANTDCPELRQEYIEVTADERACEETLVECEESNIPTITLNAATVTSINGYTAEDIEQLELELSSVYAQMNREAEARLTAEVDRDAAVDALEESLVVQSQCETNLYNLVNSEGDNFDCWIEGELVECGNAAEPH